ncbi:hypothetical protein PR202_gb24664 [Eleusine coracana subsp. coracana]|uniref:Uncharacterized protein n=1 Tax=Eleusine coracana subsp. coracana TaxID=191504 RepID=A0AAV5FLN2_ELECO|nr:hypothetical protein QOZ80_5BG0450980 [Eleusine coracana subsp. coracana]GJN35852.1 hypothetical protein PR202_gb24664 [Eleusine coracana subsp. coracana]
MTITVTKSSPVLVGPATAPPPAEHVKLTSFDKALAFFPVTSFHVFDHAIPEPAETVRRGLSRALVHYFPVAGRLVVVAGDDDLRIACTGEGVSFVAATADCSLADVKLLDPPFGNDNAPLMRDLAAGGAGVGEEGFRASDPLLLVQVTEFACGGFVLAATRNHAVADGTGFAQLLRAAGDLARGAPRPSLLPVTRGGGSLPLLPPRVAAMERALLELPPRDFAYLDVTVPFGCINRIKSEFFAAAHASGDDDGEEDTCTVFEAVVAVLWRCRTRVVMTDADAPAPLVFAASVRDLVGAERGYYGNCITSAVAVPTSGEVASGSVVDMVRLIKRAKNQMLRQFRIKKKDDNLVAGAEEGEEGHDDQLDDVDEEVMFGYNALDVTSWRNLGADAVDFGGGTPARVMCRFDRMPVPYCVACPPCRGKDDGANVLARCVREEHVDAFLGELTAFF